MLMSELAVAPLYIFQVIVSISTLIVFRKEKGCLMGFYKIGACLYISIYVIAFFMYVTGN